MISGCFVCPLCCLHILSLFNMKQILAFHILLQQASVLQHQGLDLTDQMPIFFFKVPFQLTQQLNITCRNL